MKLADRITIVLAGEEIELHPALRYAIRLERREGSLRKLLSEVSEGSLTAAVEIINDHCPDGDLLKNRIFDAGLDHLAPALTRYVLACSGIDDDHDEPARPSKRSAPANTQTLEQRLRELYRQGTGWLGWTPEITLDATPAEIAEAYRGKLEMLRAVYGGGDEQPKPDMSLDDQFRTAFASFGTRKVERAA